MARVRPGSTTANAIQHRQMMAAGAPPNSIIEWYVQRVTHDDFSDADTSQVLTLNTLFPNNAFPTDAFLTLGPFAYIDLIEVFAASGLTDADFILGVSGDTNGLVEVQAAETGQSLGRKLAPGTLYAADTLDQTAMSPLLQLDTAGANIDTLTSGIIDVYIPYVLMPSRRAA